MSARTSDWRDLLPHAKSIALAAAEEVSKLYRTNAARRRKADGSLVTSADTAAEALIVPRLESLLPGVAVVSEEAASRSTPLDFSSSAFWLVDPLDGTREFCASIGEFTVNIALVEGGHPVLGVIAVPATGELFAAAGPGTAVRIAAGREEAISARAEPSEGLTVLHSRFHADAPEIRAFLRGRRVKETLARGSSVKFCDIARGAADLYVRTGPTREWDTAAGQAVLESAGGSVDVIGNGPLGYGKPGLLNPGFVARGRRAESP